MNKEIFESNVYLQKEERTFERGFVDRMDKAVVIVLCTETYAVKLLSRFSFSSSITGPNIKYVLYRNTVF